VLQPTTHTWKRAVPTGLGFDPSAYRDGQRLITQLAGFDPTAYQGLRGLGLNTSAAIPAATAAASTAIGIYGSLVATGSIAGPVGLAVSGAIALGVAIYNLVQGCGSTCTEASNIANQVAALLQQNLDQYMSAPVHYASAQQAALTTFNSAWAQLVQMCGNPQLSTAGQNCISQRSQSGCQWKTSPAGWSQDASGNWTYTGAGPNGSGSTCWNWFVGYYDPIANDPTVVPDPVATSSTTTTSPVTGASTTTTVLSNGQVVTTPASSCPLSFFSGESCLGGFIGTQTALVLGAGLLALLVLGD
jgi:hypothetical protein